MKLLADAEQLESRAHLQGVVDHYKSWIAWNPEHPLLCLIYFNYAVALGKIGDRAAAMVALRECTRLKPDFYPSYINLGRLFEDSGQAGTAVAQWTALVNCLPQVNGESVKYKVMALQQIGRVLESNHCDAAAEDALKQALDINAAQPDVIQHWIALRQRQCKWPVVAGWENVDAKTLMAGISPLSLANLADDPMFLLARAWHYNKNAIGMPQRLADDSKARPMRAEKLRIGYLSSDLREHAVGFAMTDVFETHERRHFEIYAYYCGIERTDPTQLRIKRSADHWVDVNKLDDDQAAARIREDGIDILVDLNGYTKDARTKVLARRPAPVLVNWFGYPGTMGSPYHHYIIADAHIVPPESEIYYSEKVLRLPCYQPNDRHRRVAERLPTRVEERVPEPAFVYCSLNGTQKMTPAVFDAWLRILRQVPGSVLWLLSGGEDANARLRQIAAAREMAPERLIFADKKPNPEHLARYALADLFLDSFPYGAHTTAADAMWMGVPVLTVPGRSFASRVCTSLVRAAGLEECVCKTAESYVARAIEYGRNPAKLAALKKKLRTERDACLLFDTPQLVRRLEELYRGMWHDFESGSLPLPDLSNLDVYHDIGVALNVEDPGTVGDETYRARYAERLARWHRASPIKADRRLWTNPSRAPGLARAVSLVSAVR
jgi:predicted O-linked N-acetylglucosamine transferase (SPINDLY family)